MKKSRSFLFDLSSILVVLPFLILPFVTTSPLLLSLSSQIAIGVMAAMGVYIMLRMGLLSFTVPAFMAIGGYAAAITAKAGTSDLFVLTAVAFVVPVLFAIPLGALVLRLRGVYFIFITFVTNEILQVVLFELPSVTGGANGIAGVPPATLFSNPFTTESQLTFVTMLICLMVLVITFWITQRFRAEFSSIEENETLTESLGLTIWKYRLLGLVVSAGVSGMAGLALVNTLSTAHPSSFASWSVNSYVAYVFVGGRNNMLGVVVGSVLLIVISNLFSSYAGLSAGLFGLLLVLVLTMAPRGIVGTLEALWDRVTGKANKKGAA